MTKDISCPSLLSRLLLYDAASGKLFWKTRTPDLFQSSKDPEKQCSSWNKGFSGSEAATSYSYGYKQIRVLGKKTSAHRVAWAIYHGTRAPDQIDHINGNRDDNRIENLRPATCTEQRRNAAKPKTNSSGHIGVSWHKHSKKWRAFIHDGGKQISVGYFNSIDDAVRARKLKEIELGYHENHGR